MIFYGGARGSGKSECIMEMIDDMLRKGETICCIGDRSAATNTGYRSAATVEGKESFAIATGIEGKARGKKGCYIALAEWEETNDGWKLKNFKSHKVDGKTIKEDVFYMLKNGKFVEVE